MWSSDSPGAVTAMRRGFVRLSFADVLSAQRKSSAFPFVFGRDDTNITARIFPPVAGIRRGGGSLGRVSDKE